MKKITRGTGITKKEVIETKSFNLHFHIADQIEQRFGREADWFDFAAFNVLEWAEETLKNAIGQAKPDSPEDFACRILHVFTQARRAIDKGEADRAAYYAVEFGELKTSITIKKMWEPAALKGQKFNDGPKCKRMDALSEAMLKNWQDFKQREERDPTAAELWKLVDDDCIQEKDEDDQVIYWRRANGKETKTAFKSFQQRFTNLKKKYKK
jgi:hypothetical protein